MNNPQRRSTRENLEKQLEQQRLDDAEEQPYKLSADGKTVENFPIELRPQENSPLTIQERIDLLNIAYSHGLHTGKAQLQPQPKIGINPVN